MKQLTTLIIALEEKVPLLAYENLQISKANVGWHIQHSLMVVNNIINVLKNADPKAYQWSFNLNRVLVFSMGKIPRGKGKAPKTVLPQDDITSQLLYEHIEKAKISANILSQLHKHQHFKHPYFGQLNLKSTKKFLMMHTKHHLEIIEDILKSKA